MEKEYENGRHCLFQLCITLNNIEHVRLYLGELPQLLAWDNIEMMISTRYIDDSIGKQSTVTLHRLIDTANEEILMKVGLSVYFSDISSL